MTQTWIPTNGRDEELEGPTVVVDVPKRFYEDHVERENLAGVVVKVLASTYRVELDAAAYLDLLSDAEYHSDAVEMMGSDYLGLQASARGTLARLQAVERTPAQLADEQAFELQQQALAEEHAIAETEQAWIEQQYEGAQAHLEPIGRTPEQQTEDDLDYRQGRR